MSFPLERTLVIGASVSAATVDCNPVKRLLRRHGVLSAATTHARNGSTAVNTLQTFDWGHLANVSAVVTIDLFFWDSLFSQPTAVMNAMDRFFAELDKRGIPALIANVPHMVPFQTVAPLINEGLERHTRDSESFHLFDSGPLVQDALGGEIVVDGRSYGLGELLPDGLHPSPIGAEFISRALDARLGEILSKKIEQTA